MKKICLDLTEAKAIGDTLCSTPVLRKLYDSYNSKIIVVTDFPELFKNNPLVEKVYQSSSINRDFINSNFISHNSFYEYGQKNNKGIEFKHNRIDIRQSHAIKLGFMLTKDEMELDYIPDTFEPINKLPEKYVLIHPVQNWPSRTWDAVKWMELTKKLNEQNISVVSIGKESSEVGFFNVKKPIFNFEIKNGINLMNKTTLSQSWHLIDKSMCFITMDSGLLHLAGTTDSNILQLGSSINKEFRAPYRNGSQDYKYHYVGGGCSLFCGSDMKYGVKEWGDIQGVPPLINCLENKPTFECHPSVDQVIDKLKEIIQFQEE
jgi:ADP-heptose:LPS heptosyltransferase